MLSDPNIGAIVPKVGNRYEAVLAIAKRARNIENKRVIEGDNSIKDAVDIASIEIAEEKVFVRKAGKYVIEPNVEIDFEEELKINEEDKEELNSKIDEDSEEDEEEIKE